MKIIISVDGVKREIHGSFSVCGGRNDLEALVHYLEEGLREGFGYGWIDIHSEVIQSTANKAPYDWYQGAD